MIYDIHEERPRKCSEIRHEMKIHSLQIRISCWGRENSVCKYLDRVQSGLFDKGKLFKIKIILLCFKIFSIAGIKITLKKKLGVGEIIFGRQWPRFSTCKVAITALIGFSLVLRHNRLQLVDVGASEVGDLGGTR